MQKKIFRILSQFAKKRGISVLTNAPLPECIKGLWWIDGQDEYIFLSSHMSDSAKRNFVFAHELGHSVLHKEKLDNARYQENGWNNEYLKAVEAEADAYAAQLIGRLTKVVSINA